MTPERWQEISDSLDKALQLPPGERSVYLHRLGSTDSDLRQQVESLLESHVRADSEFLQTPLKSITVAHDFSVRSDSLVGKRLGVYEIVERIGEGGMGEVYRAVRADDQYRKQVAVKFVRRGQDSGFVTSRFRNERQILATLEHPNIARLLDGGTTDDGMPYFVMELIEGVPINQYCDGHNLSTTERLKLFGQVCSAVQYAHQRLIVHRDLKPGNILVSEEGTPKLLDFGIAKILDAEDAGGPFEPTMTLFRALTPGYASPEQIKGEPITTATDVYSLGVILYELLTGCSPYRVTTRSSQELARAVCEFEPERPSTAVRKLASQAGPSPLAEQERSPQKLSKRLSGDLDTIVLMALRKEPQRRYASVEQLAEDIRRHLENLPVIARDDTSRYRASKFFARHRAGVVAATATTIVLVAALVVTVAEARIARRQAELARQERARAERRFNDVRKLANSLIFELHDSIAELPGATNARKILVIRASEYLDSLSKEAGGDPSLQRELANAYDRLVDVLGYDGAANLGDYSGASEACAKAIAIREFLVSSNPSDLKLQQELSNDYWRNIWILRDSGSPTVALQVAQKALPLVQKMAASNSDSDSQELLAGFYWLTGFVLEVNGDADAALQDYRQAVAILEPLARDPKAKPLTRGHLVADYNGIAKMLSQTGHPRDAIPIIAKSTETLRQLSEQYPGSTTWREWLAESYNIWASILFDGGDFKGSIEIGRKGLGIFQQLHAADPNNHLAGDNVGFAELTVARALLRLSKFTPALELAHSAVSIFQPRAAADLNATSGLSSSNIEIGAIYAARAAKSASTSLQIADWRQSRLWYEKAQHVWDKVPERAHFDAFGKDQAKTIAAGISESDSKLRELTVRAGLRSH
jgi:serine/threonine protein kinase/tetratricopeptide (TPR) repeat protein